MTVTDDRSKLLIRAAEAKRESKYLDFKSAFATESAEAWCEVIKDIVAFANSGGGIIIFGVDNDGRSSSIDPTQILACDLADITNRIARYTGYQFDGIDIVEVRRDGAIHAAFLISPTDVPIIFTKPGTYDIGGGKQKTAFGVGTIYFRHGAKSEPGNRTDLETWRDRAVAQKRQEWLRGIRKVVHAPKGHTVSIVPSAQSGLGGAQNQLAVRISARPDAPAFVPYDAEKLWPHRQKTLLNAVNRQLPKGTRANGHDILCVNRKLDVFKAYPKFAYRPHKLASPQYSDAYVAWIIDQATKNPDFFRDVRAEYRTSAARKV